jgi:hypothetical protein
MPSVIDGHLTEIGQPHHDMGCADPYFVITARAAVGFERSRCGYRPHLIVVPIRPRLHPARSGQRPERLLPTR